MEGKRINGVGIRGGSHILEPGAKAPAFSLPNQNRMTLKVFGNVKVAENPARMLEELKYGE